MAIDSAAAAAALAAAMTLVRTAIVEVMGGEGEIPSAAGYSVGKKLASTASTKHAFYTYIPTVPS